MPPNPKIHPPYGRFRGSTTPPGLYARQKWLGESSTATWKSDFAATVAGLYRGQNADGLWRKSAMETIQRLFGLHLTVRNPDSRIDRGLDALLDVASAALSEAQLDRVPAERLQGLPFTPGPRPAILVPATLFLCAIFGRSTRPSVLRLYDQIAGSMGSGRGRRETVAWRHNLLRALVVHPRYADHPATRRLVDWMADRQTRQGDWGAGIPFYQALNALAHLDNPPANRQTERALDHLVAIQRADGSWGASERQWSSFLAVHALRNKGRG